MNKEMIIRDIFLFAIVAGTDYTLDQNVKRALIVGAVACFAVFIIEDYLLPAVAPVDQTA